MDTTADHILDAVERLICIDSQRKLTIDAVAAEAGMSKGGVLYNFRSKQELLLGVIRRAVSDFRTTTYALSDTLREQGAACPTLRASFQIYRDYREKAAPITLFALAAREPELVAEFQEMSAEIGQAISTEVNDPILGHMCELIVDGLYYRQAMQVKVHSTGEIDELIDRVLEITSQNSLHDGLKAEAGN
ncbi:HTH-type transcriptional regulator BetI [Pseudovibrio axinellae]|uniref:HTH-type transcriptional regulator BetI n=1 Tax=Pseudovibrio axinellae TaxID=989403 RepID=A0A166AM22_9HYPH|nr:TetR/AcrR family transcriptional regulator [Pseudovibrio axinellae]KZL21296.1 HTH-type transcriptional regulator BetI [Pseudovibrio axinellae]SEQ95169.1 transcriptional regulator, TetR family [Pseudovibrio axinellae]